MTSPSTVIPRYTLSNVVDDTDSSQLNRDKTRNYLDLVLLMQPNFAFI